MDWEKHCLRVGALVLAAAVLIRLAGAVPQVLALNGTDLLSAMIFLETGRHVQVKEAVQTQPTQPDLPVCATVTEKPQLPVTFSSEDLALLQVNNFSGYSIDPEALLQESLSWELTQEGPAVLILHTHATECYRNTGDFQETARFRTLDRDYNVVSIGAELARILEEGGIQVLHDTTLHDEDSYNDAYTLARQTIQNYLTQYPSIRLVLDIHRDAAEDPAGEQVAYTSQLGGQTAAQLMIVTGSDAGGLHYPNWQENLAVGVQLQTALEKTTPGLCRPLCLRAQRYNQDLHPASLLVEVGAAGNTHQEAMLAVQALGQGILEIAQGTRWEEN